MKAIEVITNSFWRWLDSVADFVIALVARIATPRTVRLIEGEHGQFTMVPSNGGESAALSHAELRVDGDGFVGQPTPQIEAALRGSRVELLLRPDRFVFKPLDLPQRAGEFLDGVVRAQIDRLTPWSADLAAFGFSPPVEASSGRIVVTVAATAKAMLAPVMQAFRAAGAHFIMMSVSPADAPPTAPAITIMEQDIAGVLSLRMARRILLAVLASCALIAATAAIAATIINGSLESRQDQLAQRIAERRAAAMTARNAPDDPIMAAERALAQRKNGSPSTVIALEVLSKILPDHTYLTELRIEGDKVRLTGVTHDAPGLIRLIERSRHFTQATFFAPVTRSQSATADKFNIEARLEPVFTLTP